MPMVDWATAGTATVKLTVLKKPDGNLKQSLIIEIPGCFIKNDENLQHFVNEFIDGSADRNKFHPGNSKYIFYSGVSNFKGDVNKAVFSYEKISKGLNTLQQKTKTCTVEKPLVITFDGHFFLCCDSKDLNKSKFLEKYSKEVRINQTLDHSKGFYGIGKEYGYLQVIHSFMCQGQSHNDKFNKLEEAGPLILNDKKTIVGCYRKSNGNCRFKINMFEKSQGHPAPDSPPPGPSEGEPAPHLPPIGPLKGDPVLQSPPTGLSEGDPVPHSPPPGPSEGDPVPHLPSTGLPEGDPASHSPPPGPPGDNRQLATIEHQDQS